MNNQIKKFYDEILKKVLYSDKTLTSPELKKIKSLLNSEKDKTDQLNYEIMQLGMLLDYNELKLEGKSKTEIQNYYDEDIKAVNESSIQLRQHLNFDSKYMFGYPANMMKDSYVTAYLRFIESKLYFMNSCGNAYGKGNYKMGNNVQELRIIDLVKKNLDLPDDQYWGYISMDGTESNIWGIREGFSKYKNGILYYSDNSHYSVSKAVDMMNGAKCVKINCENQKIDCKELISEIEKNYKETKSPAILVLTYGTTTYGSIDDVKTIKEKLVKLGIPHYIHLDAALYGGIPKNQIGRPGYSISDLNIDSIAISLHKYYGNTRTNGILLANGHLNENFISYIGQNDITLMGSRDFLPFSTLQRMNELLNRSNENDYINAIKNFEKLLNKNGISFQKGDENGNIFIIEKPSDEICKKYQLATFSINENDYAHIIIFPYHDQKIIEELINDIKSDIYYTQKTKRKSIGGKK